MTVSGFSLTVVRGQIRNPKSEIRKSEMALPPKFLSYFFSTKNSTKEPSFSYFPLWRAPRKEKRAGDFCSTDFSQKNEKCERRNANAERGTGILLF